MLDENFMVEFLSFNKKIIAKNVKLCLRRNVGIVKNAKFHVNFKNLERLSSFLISNDEYDSKELC